mgnify:CR=1 FL=1
MNISFIGSGNVATVLAKLAVQAGHTIHQIYSRQPAHAEQLARQCGAQAISQWAQVNTQGLHVLIISVSDAAIGAAAQQLASTHCMVVHTAGTVSRQVLAGLSPNYGVLYPLQTLRANQPLPSTPLPLLVDAATPDDLAFLQNFAQSLSKLVATASDEQRRHAHLCAVICNNFTNHLAAFAQTYANAHGVDFNLLQPLLYQTFTNISQGLAPQVQTGPAQRGDISTMEAHLALLAQYPLAQKWYEALSRSIWEGVKSEK